MSVDVSLSEKDGYISLLITGSIISIDEYRELSKQCCSLVKDYSFDKLLIDETGIDYSPSFLLQSEIVEHYEEDLCEKFKNAILAVVVKKTIELQGDFWVMIAREAGYTCEVFCDVPSALRYLGVQ